MNGFSINIKGTLHDFSTTAVMGIINVTPDSFYADSHSFDCKAVEKRVETVMAEGADIIDIGGYSSRPGATDVPAEEEMRRVKLALEIVRAVNTDIPVSVDTFRASIARTAVEQWGADIINDISGGTADKDMFDTVAELNVPYVLMHMRGTPATMQSLASYGDVTADVIAELSRPLHQLTLRGVSDIIIDPGFGFAKTLEQNYELFNNIDKIAELLGRPLLVGISRKSMVTRLCGITPGQALPGTSVLNAAAVLKGASILRVHDVAAAHQAIKVASQLRPQPALHHHLS